MDGSGIARNTVLNFAGNAIPLAVGVLTIPPILHWLGADRFGILSLTWVVIGYFGFLDLGLGRSTTKFVAEALGKGEPEKVPGFFWTTVILQTLLGALGTLILVLATPLIVEKALKVPPELFAASRATFHILAASLPVVLVSASFRGVLEACQRFDLVNLVKIPSSSVNYLMPLAGLLMGFDLPGIMLLLVGARVLTLAAWIAICLKAVPGLGSAMTFRRDALGPMLAFGGWLTVSNLVGPLLLYVDRFFIGSLVGVGAVGVYSAPYELVARLGIVPGSLLQTLFPAFSALNGGKARATAAALFERSVRLLLFLTGMIVLVLVFVAGDFLSIWLGPAFAGPSTPVFRILVAGFFFNSLASVPFILLQGIGRADLTAKFHIGEAALYVPLTWALVARAGIVGAAWAWLVRVALDAGLLFWAAARSGGVGNGWVRSVGRLGGLFAAAGLCTFGLLRAASPWRYGGFMVLVALLGLAGWARVLDAPEKAWLASTWRRLSGRREAAS